MTLLASQKGQRQCNEPIKPQIECSLHEVQKNVCGYT